MRNGALLKRVSTAKQADQGESWQLQEERGRRFAAEHGIEVVKVFQEPYTGREIDRPVLNLIFAYLQEHPEIDVLIVTEIDRFTRGGSEYYHQFKNRLLRLGVELLDVVGTIQPSINTLADTGFEYDWSRVSPSRIGETVIAENARQEVTNFLTRTIRQQIHLARNGYSVRPAPLGMQNKRIEDSEGKKKTILVPRPVEARWIRAIFDLRAEGVLSDQEICDRVNAQGFRTRIQRKRDRFSRKPIGTIGGVLLTPKRLHKYIRQPKYCGIAIEKWTGLQPVRMPSPGLVSVKTFNLANRGKVTITEEDDGSISVSHDTAFRAYSKTNPHFPYRSVVCCHICSRPFVGSFSRGKLGKRYPNYHCSREHEYVRISKDDLHKAVESYVQRLRFPKHMRTLFEKVALDVWEQKQQEDKQAQKRSAETIRTLTMEQEHLVVQLTKTSSTVVRRLVEGKIGALEHRITNIKNQKQQRDIQRSDLKAYLAKIKAIMKNPASVLLQRLHPEPLQNLWKMVFEKLPTIEDLTNGTPKMTVAFELCGDSRMSKSQLAAQLKFKWNLLMNQVKGQAFS